MRHAALLALLPLLGAACGSWSTVFRPRDPSFAAGPLHHDPHVFVDHVPTRRYVAVGTIEVRAPSSQPLDAFLERAIPEARARGCELLVARHLHLGAVRGPIFVAQSQTFGGTVTTRPGFATFGTDEPRRTRREFICGVYERA